MKPKRPGIDVAVVLFYKKGKVPSKIHVSEITLPMPMKIPGFITGLSGHQRLDGLMHARRHADENGMEMVVIDLLVEFSKPLYPKLMRPEVVKDHDVLNMLRISKDLIAEIAGYWQQWLPRSIRGYDWDRPSDFVARRPDLLPKLLQLPQFEHINLVTHPVITTFHDQPLGATSFRVGYPRIVQANARLNPEVEVVV